MCLCMRNICLNFFLSLELTWLASAYFWFAIIVLPTAMLRDPRESWTKRTSRAKGKFRMMNVMIAMSLNGMAGVGMVEKASMRHLQLWWMQVVVMGICGWMGLLEGLGWDNWDCCSCNGMDGTGFSLHRWNDDWDTSTVSIGIFWIIWALWNGLGLDRGMDRWNVLPGTIFWIDITVIRCTF